jgi:NAD(P)-dependent dehydrogenase (short-subunit alcohol dehydrogenase family)
MSSNHGQKLGGKIAVITGGSSGIGLATAKRFVEEGAYVVIAGREEKELKEAAAFIERNVTTVAGDVSRLEDLDRLYAVVKEKHGHIDVLFANAGAGTIAPLAVATEAHFDQTFDVNVKGVFFMVQKALPSSKTAARLSWPLRSRTCWGPQGLAPTPRVRPLCATSRAPGLWS